MLRALRPRCTRSGGRSCCPSRASTSSARSPARAPDERLAGTLAALLHGVAAGAAMVRVHDVAAAVDALRVWRVLEGLEDVPEFDIGRRSPEVDRASAADRGTR